MRDFQYSKIRGFNYSAGYRASEEQLRREFGYAKKIGLNSVRIWIYKKDYDRDRILFFKQLEGFAAICGEMEISLMPILFNGNLLEPESIEPDQWEEQDRYVAEVIQRLGGHPALLMWDVMNEPSCNDYILKSEGEERKERWDRMLRFLRHHCRAIKEKFPHEKITIGHMLISDIEDHADLVDVISFHDYSPTRKKIDEVYQRALQLSEKYGKPVINSELCCLCRGNPYDVALEKAYRLRVGWYLFELMIDGYWGDIHGIFYQDGTVRDPSAAAAAMGIFRNRGRDTAAVTPNKEGHVKEAVRQVEEALNDSTEAFRYAAKPIETVLEAAEFCANLLEACHLVPMDEPPSARIQRIREENNRQEARKIAFELACILKKECQIL